MPSASESQILAEVLDKCRQLTLFYWSKIGDADQQRRFQVGEFTSNSAHWLLAHLAWGEDFLVLRGVGNQSLNAPWFESFCLGAPYPAESAFPSVEETLRTLAQAHEQTLKLLRAYPAQKLDEPNHVEIEFNDGNSQRIIIQHCIRHEGAHAGHLGWLVRMCSGKVI